MPPTITEEGQAAKDRIAAARAAKDAGMTSANSRRVARGVEPTISANDLVTPVQAPSMPAPAVATPPTAEMARANAVANENDQIIGRELESFKEMQNLRGQLSSLADQGSLSDMFTRQQEELGIPENIRQLKDIQLQLADMDTGSELTKTRIAGAAGQTLGQAGREVTQEDRENAVRRSGLAAQAAVLQGNIQTARQTALDAVNIAYQDRQLQNQNLIQQIEVLQGQVDNETAQLLEQEKRKYEADQAAIAEVKQNVSAAMATGAATPQEVALLTDPNATDEQRNATAQAIIARGAGEMRDLTMEAQRAGINASNASAAASWALASQRATDELISRAEAGDQDAIAELGITMSDNTLPTSDEIAYARQYASTGQIPSGLSSAGISFGRIAELAADLPKPDGTLVNRDTGVAPDGLNATERTAYENLYNAINTDLPRLMESWEEMNSISNFGGTGVVGGIASTINPSEANVRFETAKADFLAKLLVARSGAAVTEQEYERYAKLIPGKFNTPMGIGTSGTDKLVNLNEQMNLALQDKMATRGLAIYGYSTIETPEGEFTVGETITNEYGQVGRVNPDGTITLINQ